MEITLHELNKRTSLRYKEALAGKEWWMDRLQSILSFSDKNDPAVVLTGRSVDEFQAKAMALKDLHEGIEYSLQSNYGRKLKLLEFMSNRLNKNSYKNFSKGFKEGPYVKRCWEFYCREMKDLRKWIKDRLEEC